MKIQLKQQLIIKVLRYLQIEFRISNLVLFKFADFLFKQTSKANLNFLMMILMIAVKRRYKL